VKNAKHFSFLRRAKRIQKTKREVHKVIFERTAASWVKNAKAFFISEKSKANPEN